METEDIAAAAIRRRRHWHGQRYDLCLSRLPGRVELIGDAGVAVLDSTALKVAFYSSGCLRPAMAPPVVVRGPIPWLSRTPTIKRSSPTFSMRR
jgi:hypothetical protein